MVSPKYNAIYIVYILTVLHRYKIKCELTLFHYNPPIFRQLLDHVVETGGMIHSGDRIDNSDQGAESRCYISKFDDYIKVNQDSIEQDKVMDELSRRITRGYRETWRAGASNKYDILKYPVDFSEWALYGRPRWYLGTPNGLPDLKKNWSFGFGIWLYLHFLLLVRVGYPGRITAGVQGNQFIVTFLRINILNVWNTLSSSNP